MVKNNKDDNALIKKKGLVLILRKSGIKRINNKAIEDIEDYTKKIIKELALILKEEMTIQGRKTLTKKDVANSLKKLKKENNWEV